MTLPNIGKFKSVSNDDDKNNLLLEKFKKKGKLEGEESEYQLKSVDEFSDALKKLPDFLINNNKEELDKLLKSAKKRDQQSVMGGYKSLLSSRIKEILRENKNTDKYNKINECILNVPGLKELVEKKPLWNKGNEPEVKLKLKEELEELKIDKKQEKIKNDFFTTINSKSFDDILANKGNFHKMVELADKLGIKATNTLINRTFERLDNMYEKLEKSKELTKGDATEELKKMANDMTQSFIDSNFSTVLFKYIPENTSTETYLKNLLNKYDHKNEISKLIGKQMDKQIKLKKEL